MPGRRDIGAGIIESAVDPALAGDIPTGGGGGLSLSAVAELSASVGRMAAELESQAARQRALWAAVRPIPGIAVPPITASGGTADYPELLAPREGYWWDVKTATAATFTAGSVNLYAGGQSDSTLRYVFTAAGTYAFGTAQLLVPPGQRLIFTAVGVTGNVTPSLTVIEIAAWALPAYLM
jgi:hypothetical protein